MLKFNNNSLKQRKQKEVTVSKKMKKNNRKIYMSKNEDQKNNQNQKIRNNKLMFKDHNLKRKVELTKNK